MLWRRLQVEVEVEAESQMVPMTRAEEAALGVQEPASEPSRARNVFELLQDLWKITFIRQFRAEGMELYIRLGVPSEDLVLFARASSFISDLILCHALGASVEPLLHHIVSCLGFLFLGANSGEASTEDMRRR